MFRPHTKVQFVDLSHHKQHIYSLVLKVVIQFKEGHSTFHYQDVDIQVKEGHTTFHYQDVDIQVKEGHTTFHYQDVDIQVKEGHTTFHYQDVDIPGLAFMLVH